MAGSEQPNDATRFATIESTLMMLQYDFEKLNDVVLAQQSEIYELKRTLASVETRLTLDQPEERSLEDERPPHY